MTDTNPFEFVKGPSEANEIVRQRNFGFWIADFTLNLKSKI